MSRTTKRFLSILLAAAMILSLGITGWAIDDEITIVDPTAKPAVETDKHVTDAFDGGTDLELEEIDPNTLGVPRLGEIEEEDNVLTSEDLPFGLNDIVRVSIVLDRPSTMDLGYSTQNIVENNSAMAYRHTLKQQQANIESAIANAGVSMNVKWNLTLAVNIISAEVRYGDIETIEAVPGVKEVWLETRYEPQVDGINTAITTENMVGAATLWSEGYTGAGTRVAIIDTGTDYKHQSFDPEAFMYALSLDEGDFELLDVNEVKSVLPELNANNTADKHNIDSAYYVYKNAKIPFAYNYIDGNNTTDHLSDTKEEHGSHVSGIAAANRFIKKDGKFVEAATEVFAVGVAPDAQILTMKVFGAGGGAYDSDYMAAIEDAIILKADSINLSLGSGAPGYTFSNGYQEVMDSLINCGSVVAISAGNAYDWAYFLPSGVPYLYLDDVSLHTGGSPGTFVNSLCVAAAQNIGTVGTPLKFSGYDSSVFYTETEGYGNANMSSIPGTYDFVLVDGPGVDDNNHVGQEGDAFLALGSEVLTGKIAMCYRGTSSFFAKANAAAAQGAAAVIIINNQPGSINMNLTGYEYTVPAVSILQAEGEAIKAAAEPVTDEDGNVLYYKGTVTVANKMETTLNADRSEATITDFSSWGVPGSLIMKPEITAPGGNIYSVFGSNKHADGSIAGGSDQYEFMSGTSMAAPHVTGMAALLSEYIRDNNLEEVTGLNRRTLINSLLMSTATPMMVDGAYLPVLQQGAGLGDTYAATQALSYIMMGEDATASAADGKVKVELGQDAARSGEYSFSFNVNNFSDTDLVYELRTDMFTQAPTVSDGNFYMLKATMDLAEGEDFTVSYAYPQVVLSGHDVNKDGATNAADAQAILDYLTGKVDGETLDLEAAEMDEVDGISSYDAQLLLKWEEQSGLDNLLVPAGESVSVTVTITYADELKEFLDAYYVGGAYVEGYTYVLPVSETEDGALLDVAHSIPILGFYGSWTDASMFDCVDPISTAYGSTKESYTGNPNTNYLTLNYGKGNTVFMGNPYVVEKEYHPERAAVSSGTKLINFKYNMIRNAATSGWMAFNWNTLDILKSNIGGAASGAWYYVNGQAWQDTATQTAAINTTPAKLGLNEDDMFMISYFAIPEYYGMMLHPGENVNTVTDKEILNLLATGELGWGSALGYVFTVDNTAPEATAKMSEDGTKITVTAKDNNYIAYVAIMDVSGNVAFAQAVPEQTKPGEEVEVTFDISELDLPNGIAIFVGDYAANEKAYLVVFDPDKPVTGSKTVYVLTDTLEEGKDYIIANVNTGAGYALGSQGTQAYVAPVGINIVTDELGTYIPLEDVDGSFLWTSQAVDGEGIGFVNSNDGGGLSYNQINGPYVNWAGARYVDGFVYQNNTLLYGPYASYGYGMKFANSNFCFGPGVTPIYLFTKGSLEYEMDPNNASSVTVAPEAATLILDVLPTIELTANVEPIVLPDRTVTWTSSNEEVATVNADGLVTAVAPGTAVITATSNQTPDMSASATINVTAGEPMNATVYGQVAFGREDIEYAEIDLSNMGLTNLSGDAMFSAFTGGGRSGDFIYGNDVDNDMHRYNAEDNFAYDSDYHFVISAQWALWDAANFPAFTMADYANVNTTDESTDNDEPALTDYPYILTGFNSSSKLMYFKEDGNLTYFDLSGIGGFIAATFVGAQLDEETGLPNLYYVLLGDDGTLYNWIVYPNLSNGGMSAQYGEIGHVTVLTIGEDKSAYSMSYYESEDTYGVFIADGSIGGIYYVDFTEIPAPADENDDTVYDVAAHFVGRINGATGLAALSDFDADAIGALGTIDVNKPAEEGGEEGNSLRGASVPAIFSSVPMSLETLQSHDVVLFEKESFDDVDIDLEPVEDDEIVIVGGLNAARPQTGRTPVVLDSAILKNTDFWGDAYVAIDVTTPNFDPEAEPAEEPVLFYNGLATLKYDPEYLIFKDCKIDPTLELTSVNVDETAGLITIAYASTEAVEEGAIAVVRFDFNIEIETEVTATTLEANDNLAVNEETVIPVVIGHNWDEPTYEWTETETGYSVKATVVCKNDSTHVETETVDAVAAVTKPATCEAKGETTYTATFENELFEVQTKTVDNIDALGHDYGEAVYEWAEDNSKVTATVVCKNDETHVITETVDTVAEVITPATCDAKGETTYTATFENELFEVQTKTVETDALGHDYGEATYEWAEDNSKVTATAVCKNDETHVETETVDTTYEVVTEPTTEAEGLGRYTATFENELFETQTKEVSIEKLAGFKVIVEDKTNGKATTDLVAEQLYSGEKTFTVKTDDDQAVLVAVKTTDEEGNVTYTREPCTTDEEGVHSFTITVNAETTIVLAMIGDVNLDGEVKLKDSLMIKKHIAGTEEITDPLAFLVGDVNGDGAIKLKDNLSVKKAIAGTDALAW